MGDFPGVGGSATKPDGGISRSLRRLIDAGALWVLLPSWRGYSGATWLEGLTLAESSGEPGAVRYEEHLDRGGVDPDAPGRDDGLREDDRSYGLMQVLGTNLREMVGVPAFVQGQDLGSGYRESVPVPVNFSWALFPMANLAFGLRFLAGLLNQARRDVAAVVHETADEALSARFSLEGPVDLALARYNGGPRGNAAADWPSLRNWPYVERVAAHAEVAREVRRRLGWVEAG